MTVSHGYKDYQMSHLILDGEFAATKWEIPQFCFHFKKITKIKEWGVLCLFQECE